MILSRPLFAAIALTGACFGSYAGSALAQQSPGAPIVQGTTSNDIAAQNAALQQQNAQLRLQISDMSTDVARLNGKVETLEFLLGQSRDEINRMQGDDAEIAERLREFEQKITQLERRLGSLNERVANVGTQAQNLSSDDAASGVVTVRNADGSTTTKVISSDAATATAPSTPTGQTTATESSVETTPSQTGYLGTISAADLPGDAGPLFQEAKKRLLQFDYAGSETAFRAFLEQFADDPQAGEAHYWLGEVLYQQNQYAASGSAYTEMITKFPDDSRAPDALVKLARSMRRVGEMERACTALNALPVRYPNAPDLTKDFAAVERNRSGCDA